jgi:hypothetical protein
MDSEDEFMSDPPSGDEEIDFDEGTQDSDIGSIDGGTDLSQHTWMGMNADK